MVTYRNKDNPELFLDPTQQDLATRQGAGSDITFGEKLLNSGYVPDTGASGTTTPKATTQKTVNAADLMAGRVDANGNPTIGQAYAGLIPGQNSDLESAYAAQGQIFKDAMNPVDENKIRADTQARFQAEIDALNRIYAEKKAQERIAGQGRLGQATAVNARRGLIGSDFGTANIGAVETQNRQVQDAIDSELELKLSSIFSKINSDAKAEAEAKIAARQQGAQQYIEFLKGASQRKEDRVNGTIANILGNNVEPDESMFSSIASQLGTTKEDIKAKYALAKVDYEKKVAEEAVKPVQVSAGAALVDPTTGKIIYQGETKQDSLKPVNLSPGETLVDPSTGKVIFTAPQKPTDNKPITQVVNKRLLQYNPETGTWSVVGAGGIGGGSSGNGSSISSGNGKTTPLSDQARAVIEGTLRLEDLTPTVRSKIAGELTRSGYKSGPKLSAGQQQDNENMATVNNLIDEVLNYNSDGSLEGVGGFGKGSVGQFFSKNLGTGTEEARQVRSLVGNIRGTIAKLRGGTSFTASEEALLNQYVPTINESPASIVSKLNGLKKFIALKQQNVVSSAIDRGVAKNVLPQNIVESAKNKYGVTY